MNNYLDLRATSARVQVNLTLVGSPNYTVYINGVESTSLQVDLLLPFSIEIELLSKDYLGPETAIIIDSIIIDNINLIPKYDYLATYINDHNNNNPTSYLGFVGKWTLTFDRPFYQWLHQATGQGWILEP